MLIRRLSNRFPETVYGLTLTARTAYDAVLLHPVPICRVPILCLPLPRRSGRFCCLCGRCRADLSGFPITPEKRGREPDVVLPSVPAPRPFAQKGRRGRIKDRALPLCGSTRFLYITARIRRSRQRRTGRSAGSGISRPFLSSWTRNRPPPAPVSAAGVGTAPSHCVRSGRFCRSYRPR